MYMFSNLDSYLGLPQNDFANPHETWIRMRKVCSISQRAAIMSEKPENCACISLVLEGSDRDLRTKCSQIKVVDIFDSFVILLVQCKLMLINWVYRHSNHSKWELLEFHVWNCCACIVVIVLKWVRLTLTLDRSKVFSFEIGEQNPWNLPKLFIMAAMPERQMNAVGVLMLTSSRLAHSGWQQNGSVSRRFFINLPRVRTAAKDRYPIERE